jgi:hypothetical protein
MRENSINRLETVLQRPIMGEPSYRERHSWSETAKSWEDNLETLITEHPRIALVAAVACGLFLGWMVKRK